MTKLLRVLLGSLLILTGFNKFIDLFSMPSMSAEATAFLTAMAETGYMMPMIGAVEILCGLLLFSVATAPLGALLLAPLSVNLIAFHLSLDIGSMLPAACVALVNVFLGFRYFDFYRSIFAKIFTERVLITENKQGSTARPVAIVS